MNEESMEIAVTAEDAGTRFDVFLTAHISEISRAQAQRLIEEGAAQVDGQTRKANYKLREGEQITVITPPSKPADIAAEKIPLDVIYEDADLLVINKPKGMTTHPAPGSPAGTLVNAVLAHSKDLSGIGGVERPGIVHRLDKDTSGLIVVAKNDKAHLSLQRQISERTAGRRYLAVVWGDVPFQQAVVDAPIGRHPVHRRKMAVIETEGPGAPASRPAKTEFRVLQRLGGMTLLEASLLTGRTHQVRVHCSFMGHRIVGDPVYSSRKQPSLPHLTTQEQKQLQDLIDNLKGQALHAWKLSFDHPASGQTMDFEAPMPPEMKALVDWMQARRPTAD